MSDANVILKTTARQIGLRLYVCLSALVSAVIAAGEPGSLNAHLLEASGPVGHAVIAAMVAMALIGLVDTVANDLLGRDVMPKAVENRSSGYVALAVLNIAWLWVMLHRDLESLLMLRYALDVSACVWVAVFDVRHRYVEVRQRAKAQTW